MSRVFVLFVLWAAGAGFAQRDSTMETIDLRLGENNPPDMMLVALNSIGTGIVFQRLPYLATCPVSRPGDFALKKVNPRPGAATSEHISMICTIIDTVSIDTTFVYEVHTPEGRLYYLRMIELVGKKVRVRLTTEKPAAIFPQKTGRKDEPSDSRIYQVDGRRVYETGVSVPIIRGSSPGSGSRFP